MHWSSLKSSEPSFRPGNEHCAPRTIHSSFAGQQRRARRALRKDLDFRLSILGCEWKLSPGVIWRALVVLDWNGEMIPMPEHPLPPQTTYRKMGLPVASSCRRVNPPSRPSRPSLSSPWDLHNDATTQREEPFFQYSFLDRSGSRAWVSAIVPV